MNQQLTPKQVYAITALTIDEKPNEVVRIIRKHGVMLPSSPSKKQIETAFGTLLPKSEPFRDDFAKLAGSVTTESFSNAEGDLPPSRGIGTTSSNLNLNNIPNPIVSTSKPIIYKTNKTFKDTLFGGFLSNVFTPETIQGGINTGLNIWSIKQTGQPASSVGTDIDSGRGEFNQEPQTKGISTTTMVLIGVGAIALIGVAVYFYKKK